MFKSFHGKYVRCMPDGKLRADNTGEVGNFEKFMIFEPNTNKIVLYNPYHGKYVKLMDNGDVMCNEANPDAATPWTTPY